MMKAIIFDVDGTLAETEEIHRKAFNQAFAIHGLGWHWNQDEYRRLLDVTGGKERIRYFMTQSPDNAAIIDDPEQFIPNLHRTKTEVYTHLIHNGAVQLRPGIRGLINEASNGGVRLAIATTTSLPNVDALLLAAFGEISESLFEIICAGDSVAEKKPAPDVYLATLEKLRLTASECVAIEDSRNGLLSAFGAGIATIVTPGIYTQHQRFGEATVLRTDLAGSTLATVAETLTATRQNIRIA